MLVQGKDYSKATPTKHLIRNVEKYNYVQIPQSTLSPKSAFLKTQVYAVDQTPLSSSIKRLKELAQLEPDWDSYGAEPVSSVALVTAEATTLLN